MVFLVERRDDIHLCLRKFSGTQVSRLWRIEGERGKIAQDGSQIPFDEPESNSIERFALFEISYEHESTKEEVLWLRNQSW